MVEKKAVRFKTYKKQDGRFTGKYKYDIVYIGHN